MPSFCSCFSVYTGAIALLFNSTKKRDRHPKHIFFSILEFELKLSFSKIIRLILSSLLSPNNSIYLAKNFGG
jgi:hypothetical protein